MATFNGDNGNNDLFGGAGNDILNGLGGNDTLTGHSGGDALNGASGNDIFVGGAGNDTLNGGTGLDQVLYYRETGTLGVTVDMQTGTATDTFGNSDTLISIEQIYGSAQGDVLLGSDTIADFFFGREGNDSLNGRGLDDTLVGDAGNDTLNGGAGNDQVAYFLETGTLGVTVDMQAGTATDTFGNSDTLISIEYVHGTDRNDVIFGSNLHGDRIFGRDGDDTIDGRDGNDLIYTGAGNDRITVGATLADARDTIVINGAGDKTIVGTGSQGTAYGHHLVFEVNEAVTVNLRTGVATSATMSVDFTGALFFLEVGGTMHADRLTGGNTAHDDLEWFVGNQGNDTIDGGTGTGDTVVYEDEVTIGSFSFTLGVQEFGTRGVVVNLTTGVATDTFGDTDTLINIDHVRGTQFTDNITGSTEENAYWGLAGNDTLNGGAGEDRVHYGEDYLTGGTAGVTVDLTAGTATDGFGDTDTLISIENVHATDAADLVTGNAVGNRLFGYGGTDTLSGGGGDDTILGGDGNDLIQGGGNNDELWGGTGNDTLDGGAGVDLARYRSVSGGVTVDLAAGSARDGHGDTDTLISIENVHGSDHNDQLTGDGAANQLFGFAGADILLGAAGSDTILGGDGDDFIQGGDGDDQLHGDAGDDTLDGGDGADVVRYRTSTTGISADLAAGSTSDGLGGTDRLIDIEHVHGSDHNDLLHGSSAANQLFGYDGNDTLFGGTGDDVLSGGNGGDTYEYFAGDAYDIINDLGQSSGGNDRLIIHDYVASNASVYRQNPNNQTVVIDFGLTHDVVVLANTLDGTHAGAVEEIQFADGTVWNHATLIANIGQVGVPASSTPTGGSDTILGTTNADTINGGDGNDRLIGLAGNDSLSGGNDNDTLIGGDGNDLLHGNGGNDEITGGAGDDTITGGSGTDTAIFGSSLAGTSVSYANGVFTLTSSVGRDVVSEVETFTFADGSRTQAEMIQIAQNHAPVSTLPDTLSSSEGSIQLDLSQYFSDPDSDALTYSVTGLPTGLTLNTSTGVVSGTLQAGPTPVLLRITASDPLGAETTSVVNWDVQNVNAAPTGAVTISGSVRVGETLTVNTSGVADADGINTATASPQWLRGGVVIAGATDAIYILTEADAGQQISVLYSYTDNLGTGESVTSAATGPVVANSGQNLSGTSGADRLVGGDANDTISGLDGADTLVGGDGDDLIFGGETSADLRDVIYGGNGNDTIDGGYGNDELRGDAGHDSIAGGFGADTVIGGTGDDTLTGSSYGDEIFGGDGMDFINGGFGHDRVNGGADADRFYHLGIADHGSDWIQDYNAAEGDVLMWGGAAATAGSFQINTADTANAGVAGVAESFIIYRPTGQIMWALVDGDAQSSINIQIAGQVFDLMV